MAEELRDLLMSPNIKDRENDLGKSPLGKPKIR
jgi:hypothetical protein